MAADKQGGGMVLVSDGRGEGGRRTAASEAASWSLSLRLRGVFRGVQPLVYNRCEVEKVSQ